MTIEDVIAEAIARRTAAGLSVGTVGIENYPGEHVRHFVTVAERDAYLMRAAERGHTTRILSHPGDQ